jgi:hypothetical protein
MRCATVILLSAGVSALGVACVPARSIPTDTQPTHYNLITASEISRKVGDTDLLHAIQALRPRYLMPSGSLRLTPPVMYINGLRVRDAGYLETVRTETLIEARFLNAMEAAARYGRGHEGGAIVVTVGRTR